MHDKHEMAWNDPGKDSKDPWGGNNNSNKGGNKGNGQQMPPEVEEMLNKFKDKLGGVFGGGSNGGKEANSGKMLSSLLLLGLIAWALTGVYIIDPDERGVVLRFGAYSETTNSGPHWHLPSPIEKVYKVNVTQVRNLELGYRSGGRSRGVGSVHKESLMLTEDENIVSSKFAVQYIIKDAKDYLFNVKDPENTLYEVSQSAIRNVVGTSKMDFVLKEGRAEIAIEVEKLIQKTLDNYKTGLEITSVNMQDSQAPDEVQAAFEDVNKAKEDKLRYISKAEAYRNGILPQARGESARILAEASAYKEQIEAKANGEASRFSQILTQYQKAPEVTRQRLFLETMEEVYSKTGKIVMDTGASNSLMMLPLEKIMSGVASKQKVPKINQQAIRKELMNGSIKRPVRTGRAGDSR